MGPLSVFGVRALCSGALVAFDTHQIFVQSADPDAGSVEAWRPLRGGSVDLGRERWHAP